MYTSIVTRSDDVAKSRGIARGTEVHTISTCRGFPLTSTHLATDGPDGFLLIINPLPGYAAGFTPPYC